MHIYVFKVIYVQKMMCVISAKRLRKAKFPFREGHSWISYFDDWRQQTDVPVIDSMEDMKWIIIKSAILCYRTVGGQQGALQTM